MAKEERKAVSNGGLPFLETSTVQGDTEAERRAEIEESGEINELHFGEFVLACIQTGADVNCFEVSAENLLMELSAHVGIRYAYYSLGEDVGGHG